MYAQGSLGLHVSAARLYVKQELLWILCDIHGTKIGSGCQIGLGRLGGSWVIPTLGDLLCIPGPQISLEGGGGHVRRMRVFNINSKFDQVSHTIRTR